MYTPIKPTTTADHLLIPISSFKKKCANIVIKKGVTKNKAVANPTGKTVNENTNACKFTRRDPEQWRDEARRRDKAY